MDVEMLGGRFALNNDFDKTVIAVAGAAENNARFTVGDVFEAVIAHDLTPSGFKLVTGLVINILGPGSSFAVAKVVDRVDCEGGGEEIGEGVNFVGDIYSLLIPLGYTGEEFVTPKLGIGNGVTQVLGELASFYHGVENCGDVVDLNSVSETIFV